MAMEVIVRDDGTLAVKGAPSFRASGTPDVVNLYGANGLFGTCAHHPTIVNAMVGPMGIEGRLQWVGSIDENPIYEALTYIGTTSTDQSSGCADCGKPTIRRCAQSSCFGRLCQMTNEIQFDLVGTRYNANVPRMALFGNVTDPAGRVLIRQGQQITDIFMLNLAAAAYNLQLDVGGTLWTGNPANNVGGRWEPTGFDLLINTGKEDVITGAGCEALDSFMMDFDNYVVGAAGSPSILAYMRRMVRQLRYRAGGAGFNPSSLEIIFVMHPNQWDAVADAVACEFGMACNTAVTDMQDAREVAVMRDRIYESKRIGIDGTNYEVVLDTQIAQTIMPVGNSQKYCADIYAIGLSVGGQLITHGEYQDMQTSGGSVLAWFHQNYGGASVKVTDGGKFANAFTTAGGFCMDVRILTKPRILMRMPWLAGRIQNVCTTMLQEPYPDVTGSGGVYEKDGGVGLWPEMYLYGDCWPG